MAIIIAVLVLICILGRLLPRFLNINQGESPDCGAPDGDPADSEYEGGDIYSQWELWDEDEERGDK